MKLLFLGASNTDCRHCFSDDNLGYGYVKYTAKKLSEQYPALFLPGSITNGGTDGFTFPRIYQKWQQMYQNIPYDIVVILGGINEVGVIQNTGLLDSAAREYLSDSGAALTQLLSSILNNGAKHILICEPFLFSPPDYLLNWMEDLGRVRRMIQTAIDSCQNTEKSKLDFSAGQTAINHWRNSAAIRYIKTQAFLDDTSSRSDTSLISESLISDHTFLPNSMCPVTTDGIHLSDAGHAILGELLFQKICAIIGGEKETDYDS